MRMCIAIPNREKVLISAAHPPNKTSPGAFAPELVLCTSVRIDTFWSCVIFMNDYRELLRV